MRSLLLWMVLVAGMTASTTAAAADYPPYLVLRAPHRPVHKHDHHGYYPGQAYAVETNAYNYGWFGAKYGKSWQRATGFGRNYTQWKAR